MKSTAQSVLKALNGAIHHVSENFRDYCPNPEKNFSRNRKLSFEDMLRIPLAMQCKSLQPELNNYFDFKKGIPSKSAFVQKRQLVNPEAFREVFRRFTAAASSKKRYKGFQLLACDGTDVNLPRNPKDTVTGVQAKPGANSYNMMHINAIYDLLSGIYTDYSFDFGCVARETAALKQMTEHIQNPQEVILIADRCYGSYSTMLALTDKKLHFVLRAKDIESNGFLSSYNLPNTELDIEISKFLTYHRGKQYCSEEYAFVSHNESGLDFSNTDTIPISFRLVRFQTSTENWECLLTDLPGEIFSTQEIMKLYGLRWGIEVSFRDLKYAVGLMYFHSKKLNSILQEVHATMIMMNFCVLLVEALPLQEKNTWKNGQKTNFAVAVGLCRSYFLSNGKTKYLDQIHRNPSSVRPRRSYHRYLHDTKPAKSMNYRMS